ncbi:MAG: sensor histidine kinase [Candidatus Marinimicrobia bacterium]|nr:sensor histidine kinase [Candidatus Neomarinimicrobiota bacterium]
MSDSRKFKIIAKYYGLFVNLDEDREVIRRISLLVTLSLFGILMTFSFGVTHLINNHIALGSTALTGAALLTLNLYLLERYKNYYFGISFGLAVFSIIIISLYLSDNTIYAWFYIYPGVATFLMGSRRGGLATALMGIPVLATTLLGAKESFFGDYNLIFELRFLLAYSLVGLFAYLFEKMAEEKRTEILAVNTSLEQTVEKRTRELSNKNLLLAREVKERTIVEQNTARALKEREILLQEVHHRTKNNLAVIMSLMNLQQNSLETESITEVLETLRRRISSMFIVHDSLYQSESLASIDFGEYIKKLTHGIQRSFQSDVQSVNLDIECDAVELNLEMAIPVGLVLNEIITNSFKYAIRPDQQMTQTIHLNRVSDNRISIDVSDNGKGLPPEFDFKTAKSLGVRMIHMLIEDQLGGTVQVESNSGTRYHLEFPYEPV